MVGFSATVGPGAVGWLYDSCDVSLIIINGAVMATKASNIVSIQGAAGGYGALRR